MVECGAREINDCDVWLGCLQVVSLSLQPTRTGRPDQDTLREPKQSESSESSESSGSNESGALKVNILRYTK